MERSSETMPSEHDEHEKQKDALWEQSQQSEVIKRLKAGEKIQTIMDSLENIQEAFTTLDTIVCSDGRVFPSEGTKLGIAGEGILLPEEDLAWFVEKYQGKIKTVTSHDDCGAAGVAFRKNPQGKERADELGVDFAKKLAKKLGAEYRHIPFEKMTGEIHNERFVCFDGTGKFNPATLKEMPGHFISHGYGFGLGRGYLKKEIEILTGIALGDHGFGKRFDGKEKFYILLSAKNAEQLEDLSEVAKKAVENFGRKVEVIGFIHE